MHTYKKEVSTAEADIVPTWFSIRALISLSIAFVQTAIFCGNIAAAVTNFLCIPKHELEKNKDIFQK